MNYRKSKLMAAVKNSEILHWLYNLFGSFFIKILGLFVRPQKNLILFSSYGGKKYDDSPRCLFEKMIGDERFRNCEMIWAFHEPNKYMLPQNTKAIQTDTLNYFITALKAKCWITNTSMTRGLHFKGKQTVCLNTWHGTPIKKIGMDSFPAWISRDRITDYMNVQGEYDIRVFSKAFGMRREQFLPYGLPRNDELSKPDSGKRVKLRKFFGIAEDKKAVLYAPTFREYERDAEKKIVLNAPIDFKKWHQEMGKQYVLLLRAHSEAYCNAGIERIPSVRDVSGYEKVNDLMIASDYLVSDYSSIFFDYAVLKKPMICFAYDYDRYANERGFYFDITNDFQYTLCKTDEELFRLISDGEIETMLREGKRFLKKYVQYCGNAAQDTVEKIAALMGEGK